MHFCHIYFWANPGTYRHKRHNYFKNKSGKNKYHGQDKKKAKGSGCFSTSCVSFKFMNKGLAQLPGIPFDL
jgi:hypothetical protein